MCFLHKNVPCKWSHIQKRFNLDLLRFYLYWRCALKLLIKQLMSWCIPQNPHHNRSGIGATLSASHTDLSQRSYSIMEMGAGGGLPSPAHTHDSFTSWSKYWLNVTVQTDTHVCKISLSFRFRISLSDMTNYKSAFGKVCRNKNRQTFKSMPILNSAYHAVKYAELRIGILLKICRFVIRHITTWYGMPN